MKLDIVRISVDRKNGKEIGKEVIGQKAIEDKQFKEGCVRFMTGLSVEESYKNLRRVDDVRSIKV